VTSACCVVTSAGYLPCQDTPIKGLEYVGTLSLTILGHRDLSEAHFKRDSPADAP
jgi:hypothetical protein